MKDCSGHSTPFAAPAAEKDVPVLAYAERAEPIDAADAEKAVAVAVDPPEALGPAALAIEPPPDGGRLAWMTVGGSFLATLATFGITNAYGVFQAYYAQNQLKGYNNSTISWIGAIQQFLLFFNGLLAGRLFDAFGCEAVFITGTVLCTLSLMMTSLCTEYYQLMLSQGLLFGLGSSLIFTPAVAAPSHWFARRRALATSLGMTGSGIGGAVWPVLIDRLIGAVGFGWAIRACGLIVLLLLCCATALIRRRLPRKRFQPLTHVWHQFSDTSFALLTLGIAVGGLGMFTPFFYLSTNALRMGAAPALAASMISFLNAGSTLGRLFAFVGDHAGHVNMMLCGNTCIVITLLAMWVPLNSVPALIAFSVLYGLLAGFVISLCPSAIAHISPPTEIGARIGLTYAAVAIFALTGPPINGALISNKNGSREGYRDSGLFSGAAVALGVGIVLVARMRIAKGRLRAKV